MVASKQRMEKTPSFHSDRINQTIVQWEFRERHLFRVHAAPTIRSKNRSSTEQNQRASPQFFGLQTFPKLLSVHILFFN